MAFINFASIDVIPVNEELGTSELIQEEIQARRKEFIAALDIANHIIDRNPEILAYYWFLWGLQDRTDLAQHPPQKITRQMVKQMAIPTQEDVLILQEHLHRFNVRLSDRKVEVQYEVSHGSTKRFTVNIALHCFSIVNDNVKSIFIASVIRHELAHVFEPQHVDIQVEKKIFCQVFNAKGLSTDPIKITYEQGEIFEIMFFGGITGRINEMDIRWGGHFNDNDNYAAYFHIHDDDEFNQFLLTYDLEIIRNIMRRKRRPIIIRQFFQSIRQRFLNVAEIFRRRINN